MHASLAKLSPDKAMLVEHLSDGGSALWLVDNAPPLPADVVRWMVCTSLGERGRHATDLAGATAQQTHAIVETLHGELWAGDGANEFWTRLDAACEVRGVPRPTWFVEEQIEALRTGLTRACAEWGDLPVGERLRLTFAAPRRRAV